MDIQKFLDRTHQTGVELAAKLGVDGSAVSNWCKGKNTPKYTVCVQLLKMGAKLDELFDEETAQMIERDILSIQKKSSPMSDEECQEIVQRGLSGLIFKCNNNG